MFNWIRELREALEKKPCASCEVLKQTLERANYEREMLLNNLLKPAAIVEHPLAAPIPITKPLSRFTPFSVKRQILEAEDREKARIMRESEESIRKAAEQVIAAKFKSPESFIEPVKSNTIEIDTNSQVDKLEKELGIGEA